MLTPKISPTANFPRHLAIYLTSVQYPWHFHVSEVSLTSVNTELWNWACPRLQTEWTTLYMYCRHFIPLIVHADGRVSARGWMKCQHVVGVAELTHQVSLGTLVAMFPSAPTQSQAAHHVYWYMLHAGLSNISSSSENDHQQGTWLMLPLRHKFNGTVTTDPNTAHRCRLSSSYKSTEMLDVLRRDINNADSGIPCDRNQHLSLSFCYWSVELTMFYCCSC